MDNDSGGEGKRGRGEESFSRPPSEPEGAGYSSLYDSFLRKVVQAHAPIREPRAGERLGGEDGSRYELRQKLGQGGMGWVFRAWDFVLQRTVALKFFFLREEGAEHALHEARAIAQLNHENILHIFDVATWRSEPWESQVPFLVMEYLEGESLAALLRRGQPPLERALEIINGIVAGLAHAHEHHIIHRDLKPSNVFITRDGTVKLLDFGLAHLIAGNGLPALYLRTAGTPRYMAPEQWRGEPQDERTDIWAVGVVLFELLTGEPPYATPEEFHDQVLSGEPPPFVRERRPDLPREVEALVAKALAKEPSRRFQTAMEFQEQLRDVEDRLGLSRPTLLPPTPQHRQITLVACWLTGLAKLSQHLDAEDLGDVEAAFHQFSVEILQHHGGSVTLCLGEKILACFGCPHARENESVYAVRAGLHLTRGLQEAIRKKLPHLPGARLGVRVGVHTAQVNLDEPQPELRRGAMVIRGSAPEIANGLACQAEPGTVLLSEKTWELVRGAFEAVPVGRRLFESLSGEAELEIYRALGERKDASRFERASSANKLTPFVGREPALRQLHERWEQALRGSCSWALISGEAGIGKSRIIQEFLESLPREAFVRMHGQCWPEASTRPFHPILEMLTRILRLDPAGSPQQQAQWLEERLSALGLLPEHRALLTALLSLPLPGDSPLLRVTPAQRKEKTLEALEALLTQITRGTPVIAIIEDLHWADPSSLQFLGHLLQRAGGARVLILLSARPEFTPPWPQRSSLHPILLKRLSPQSTESLIKEAASGRPLLPETLRQLVAKTDGIPLFIEEMTRMVVAQAPINGALPESHPSSLPVTLNELLLARLDQLPRRQRILARLCAVIGHDFTWELLSRLTDWNTVATRACLSGLIEAGILLEQEAPEPRYQFRHRLIQEAAYQSLARSTRRQHHRRVAQTLEAHFPALAEAHPELLAHHHMEAGEAEPAIRYWAKAGERASQRSANEEAVHHLSLALQLLRGLPDAASRTQEELRLLTSLGVPLAQLQRYLAPEVEQLFDRARRLFQKTEQAPPQRTQSQWALFHYYFARAKFREAYAFGEQLVAQGRQQSNRELLTIGHRMLATIHFYWGQLPAAREHIESALAYAEFSLEEHKTLAVKHWVNPRVLALAYSEIIYSILGDQERALRYSGEALELAERLSHPHTVAYALTHVAFASQLRGNSRQALEWADQSIAFSREHQFPLWLGWALVIRSWALAGVGQVQPGLELMRTSFETWQGAGIQFGMPLNFGIFTEMYLKLGQPEKGLDAVQRALSWADTTGERYYQAELHRLQGETLRALGRDGEARRCFFRACSCARRQEATIFELRAIMSLSRQSGDAKRRRTARRMLQRACDKFGAHLDSSDLRAAREQLARLSQDPAVQFPDAHGWT